METWDRGRWIGLAKSLQGRYLVSGMTAAMTAGAGVVWADFDHLADLMVRDQHAVDDEAFGHFLFDRVEAGVAPTAYPEVPGGVLGILAFLFRHRSLSLDIGCPS